MTLHLDVEAGTNAHHMIEARSRRSRARCARAIAIDPTETGVPVDEGDADRHDAIAIVDYGMGNRRSVEKAFEHVGAPIALTADHDELRAADGLVVPGVGAFPEAMRRLRALGLDEIVRERARGGRAGDRAVPRDAAALRRARTSTRAPTGSGCCPGGSCALDRAA